MIALTTIRPDLRNQRTPPPGAVNTRSPGALSAQAAATWHYQLIFGSTPVTEPDRELESAVDDGRAEDTGHLHEHRTIDGDTGLDDCSRSLPSARHSGPGSRTALTSAALSIKML